MRTLGAEVDRGRWGRSLVGGSRPEAFPAVRVAVFVCCTAPGRPHRISSSGRGRPSVQAGPTAVIGPSWTLLNGGELQPKLQPWCQGPRRELVPERWQTDMPAWRRGPDVPKR